MAVLEGSQGEGGLHLGKVPFGHRRRQFSHDPTRAAGDRGAHFAGRCRQEMVGLPGAVQASSISVCDVRDVADGVFRTRANAYRFWLCAITSIWGQLSGNGLITYFLPVLLGQAGITDENRQRTLNLVNSVTSFVGALTGTAVVDHVGRRPLLLFASFSCTAGMAIVAGLLSPTGPQSVTRANAGISFICRSFRDTMFSGLPLTCSPLHGVFLVRMDTTTSPVSGRGSLLREQSQRTRAARLVYCCCIPYQHVWTPARSRRAAMEDLSHLHGLGRRRHCHHLVLHRRDQAIVTGRA